MDRINLLRNIPVFARLNDEHHALLAANLGTQSFAQGEIVFHQGSLGNALYIIVNGQVRIFTLSEAGQELTVSIFRSGDFFGELALLDGLPRSASAQAMCATTTLTLYRAAFLHIINACPPIAAAILEVMAARLRQSTTYAEQLAGLSATERIVQHLVRLAQRHGVTDGTTTLIDLRLTQDGLASISGTTRETVNRVLSALRDQGLVQLERARIRVLDLPRLRATLDAIER
ncbi:MAG: Crp/Fnr family transcriptional regulator [Chloroflexi bacterium]|nr:Crp/Fnr family transcriptional regulator [Chloroflexota bacterium]